MSDREIKLIEHLGETIDTVHFMDLSDKKYNELKEQYYEKPPIKAVEKELKQIHEKDRLMIPNITTIL